MIKKYIGRWLTGVSAAIIICGLSGCTKKIYVPMDHYIEKRDTVYHAAIERDSIWQHDSVAIVTKGDTVEVMRWRDRYKLKYCVDTLYRNRVDSIYVEVPQEKTSTYHESKPYLVIVILIGVIIFLISCHRRR